MGDGRWAMGDPNRRLDGTLTWTSRHHGGLGIGPGRARAQVLQSGRPFRPMLTVLTRTLLPLRDPAGVLAAGLLLLGGACRSRSAAAADHYRDENELRAGLARGAVPGYAGEMIEGCNYVVLLTDTLHQAAAARRYAGHRTPCPGGTILLRQVKYDFAQLNDWYTMALAAVVRGKGLTGSSITIQRNRIELGVLPDSVTHVRQLLASLPIPNDAIAVVPSMYDVFAPSVSRKGAR